MVEGCTRGSERSAFNVTGRHDLGKKRRDLQESFKPGPKTKGLT